MANEMEFPRLSGYLEAVNGTAEVEDRWLGHRRRLFDEI
jgi:hypothetical protein